MHTCEKNINVVNSHTGTRKQKKKRNKKTAEDNEGDANDVKEPDSLEDDEDTGLGSSIDSCEDLRERLRAKIEMLQGSVAQYYWYIAIFLPV